ncbi:cupin domain-containing protein [candidate division KSB1 bacterium]|nr:cupin domain-containing protein [candidate division KSB1 bacterium]
MQKEFIFIIVIVFIAGFLAGRYIHPGRAAAQKASPEYTLDNCVTVFDEGKTEAKKNGWAFWFARRDFTGGLNLKMSFVKAGAASHPPHRHDEKEIFYILQGKANFNLNGQTRTVGENTALFCPTGVPHGISNASDEEPVSYLVIKDN